MGAKGLLKDLGIDAEVEVNADSTAARRIASRIGA